jgi:hypothetical protein
VYNPTKWEIVEMTPCVARINTSPSVWVLVSGFDQVETVALQFRNRKNPQLKFVVPAFFDPTVDAAKSDTVTVNAPEDNGRDVSASQSDSTSAAIQTAVDDKTVPVELSAPSQLHLNMKEDQDLDLSIGE